MTMNNHLTRLSDFAGERLLARVEGLTDDEYFWQPVPECWTVRIGPDGTARADTPLPAEPPPFTTAAWRITHLIDILQAERTATWLGLDPDPADGAPGVPADAAAAVAGLRHAFDVWRRRLRSVDEEVLGRPMGPIAGPYADDHGADFALHILDELIHHGAEVGVVRDLYRQSVQDEKRDPLELAFLAGDAEQVSAASPADLARLRAERPDLLARAAGLQQWDGVRLLVEHGFEVNRSGPGGTTAAHLTAGAGALEPLRLLVEHGADLTVTDPAFQATPLGWAEWFGRTESADYLRGLGK